MKEIKPRLKLAIQKKGRLTDKSLQLIRDAGIGIEDSNERLMISAKNFPIDILFLRDDDIPEYVQDGVADIGIVGYNVVFEQNSEVSVIKKLGYGKCKLMIAVPENEEVIEIKNLAGSRIATSYPNILNYFLEKNSITATAILIKGSVEIAPSLGIADYICDIVSTGNTLKMNKLKKSFEVFDSEAVLIKSELFPLNTEKEQLLTQLITRIDSVMIAQNSNYLMMNAPKKNLEEIITILPSLKSPTLLPLADENMIAIHAVIAKDIFWQINGKLQNLGASDLLLLPINNMIV